ncbi:unnamed protein product [Linum trigynum]|uniref:Uncharacterized protein n=1 Tax=Linum trigynum TaxID=586398 RepID=A0AAV2ELY7_9ROSI
MKMVGPEVSVYKALVRGLAASLKVFDALRTIEGIRCCRSSLLEAPRRFSSNRFARGMGFDSLQLLLFFVLTPCCRSSLLEAP